LVVFIIMKKNNYSISKNCSGGGFNNQVPSLVPPPRESQSDSIGSALQEHRTAGGDRKGEVIISDLSVVQF
jgi:hypothetical protein